MKKENQIIGNSNKGKYITTDNWKKEKRTRIRTRGKWKIYIYIYIYI